jgi:DNA-binding LacI/PurR family transcriptional regulator
MRVEHLVSRGHQQIAFAYTGIAKWRALGDYWFEGVSRAARLRDLPPLAVGEITVDNAADVVTGWVQSGVTAVCAQSDEIACLILYGIHEARLRCPRDLAVIGVDASPMGVVSTPPLTTVQFDPRAVADAAVAAVFERLGLPTPRADERTDIARLVVRCST